MRVRALVVLLAINAAGLIIAGCAGNASPNPPASAPKIVTPPVGQTVAAGQSATFSVTGTGAAPLSYQWNKNGTVLNGATASTYVTPPANSFDNGAQFSVVVSNTSGSLATTAATLTVNSPPAITTQPSSQTVTAGQSATFGVIATGSAPLSYQWNKNGAGIGAATGSTYTTPATATTDSGAQFNVVVSNSFGNVASNAAALTVNPLTIAPAITSANSTVLLVGTGGTFTVTATGSPTVSLAETGALPSGVTFVDNGNGTGTLAGTPATGSGKIYSVTFTASNGVGTPASQSFALTVNEAPAITSRGSAAFTLGTSELFGVLTNGFPAPSLTETGTLPSGVTFTDNGNGSAKLAGIATTGAGKTFPITFSASNGIGSAAAQTFTLTVDQEPGISSANNTAFSVGTPGSFAVIATGFPVPALKGTGSLPSGVTFADGGNGVGTLSGTPAVGTGGIYSLVFTATNGVGSLATQAFTLTVGAPPVITSASSATFTVGTLGTFPVTATGTPTPVLTETGTLPGGVAFVDNHNGTATLSGTPAAGTGGTFPITIQAGSSSGSASQSFTLSVNQVSIITSASSTAFTVGSAGTFSVTATGSPTPTLAEAGTLPTGVTFVDNHNGTATLSGAPAAGTGKTYSLTFTASNGTGSPVSQTFALTVNQASAITSPNSATFITGSSSSLTVATTGFPTPSMTETGTLPGGVTFTDNHNGTGILSGTPATGTAGTYSITFVANNSVGTPATQVFTLTVNNPNSGAVITSTSSTTFTVGAAGAFSVTTTGTPTPTLTETGTLPTGVIFADNHNGTATLAGTPGAGTGQTYSVTFTATNGVGSPVSQTFTLTVDQAATITSPNSTTFNAGTSASFTVLTTGFPTPSMTETGTLPGGVTFKDNGNGTATLSGTPAAGTAAIYTLTFTATSGVGTPATQTFTLTVSAGSSSFICGTGHESVLSGQYAFFFQGFDANGPVAVAGTFSADGTGKVALLSGVEDIDTTTGAQTNVAINSASSSYSVGADNRGCLTIATASGTSKYAISLGSLTANVSGRGRMIEIDSTGTLGSGELRLVTATTAITGGFNFGVSSTESVSATTPNRFAMAGNFTASGGVITAGEADFNLSGSVDGGAAGPLAITNGSYSVSSNGRGTLTFDVSGAGTFNMAIYVVSAKEFTLVNIGAPSVTNPPFGGAAHQQSGTFSTSSLTGNIVFYSSGLCVGCGPGSTAASDVSMGVMTVSTAGSFTLTGDQNQAGTLTSLSDSGSYTVDASGRTVVQGGGGSSYILYLETTGRGFLLSTGSEVGMGFTDPQKGSPFTNASLSAALSFGTAGQTEQNVIDSSGVETFNGLGAVSGTTDRASLGSGSSSNAFNQTYAITNGTDGRGTITSGGATVSIFYMISTSHIVLMDASNPSGSANPHPAITISR